MGVHNILDLIAKGEGTSSYDASDNNGDGAGRHYPTGWKRPTQLTVDEAINMAPDLRRASGGDAVGMYQFKPRTLNDLRGWLHLDGSETMTPAMQDRMARELLHRHGYDHYLAGQIGSAKLQEGLASQWSSFAKDQSDLSRYGKGGRPVKARVPTREIQATIADAAKEGADEIQEMVDQGQLPPDWR
jgi:hypothetical protein